MIYKLGSVNRKTYHDLVYGGEIWILQYASEPSLYQDISCMVAFIIIIVILQTTDPGSWSTLVVWSISCFSTLVLIMLLVLISSLFHGYLSLGSIQGWPIYGSLSVDGDACMLDCVWANLLVLCKGGELKRSYLFLKCFEEEDLTSGWSNFLLIINTACWINFDDSFIMS